MLFRGQGSRIRFGPNRSHRKRERERARARARARAGSMVAHVGVAALHSPDYAEHSGP